jgi:hypothetical protein
LKKKKLVRQNRNSRDPNWSPPHGGHRVAATDIYRTAISADGYGALFWPAGGAVVPLLSGALELAGGFVTAGLVVFFASHPVTANIAVKSEAINSFFMVLVS